MTLRRLTQVREHKAYPDFDTDISISKSDVTTLYFYSSPTGEVKMGRCYCMIVFSRTWLHGKKIKVRWQGESNNPENRIFREIQILDGQYDRTSMVDFPNNSDRITKGNGVLYSHSPSEHGLKEWSTHEFTANTSGGNQDDVTLFVQLTDVWSAWNIKLWIDYIRVYEGDELAWSTEMTDALTLEQTGTANDYGYVGYFIAIALNITETFGLGKALIEPPDVGGYYILGVYMRLTRPKYDKIKADDHNIPRAILRLARDIILERLF